MYQDQIGYMWFAIYSSGLVRYNGTKMEVFGLEDGLRDLTVWELKEGSSGRLWVSSNAGLIVSEKPLNEYSTGESIRFLSKIGNTKLIDLSVNHNRMAVDSIGRLWVGTDNQGIVRYSFNQNEELVADTLIINPFNDSNQIPVRSIAAHKDGTMWVALTGGNLIKYKIDGQTTLFNSGSEQNISSLYIDRSGNIWGGEQGGRVWLASENGNTTRFTDVNNSLNSNISNISSDSDGTIWVSSEGSGLMKIDPENHGIGTIYNRSNGLLGEIVYNVFEDREKNLWIAQSGGISKLKYNYKAFTNLTSQSYAGERPLLPSASVGSVLPSAFNNPCMIWAGTSEGGVACISDNFGADYINQEQGLSNNWVNGLTEDSSGRLWVGTARGLNSISFDNNSVPGGAILTESISLFDKPAVLSSFPTASILAAQTLMITESPTDTNTVESHWFPAYHEVYVVINNELITLNNLQGLPTAIYHTVAFDQKRHLWLGTRDQGIYRSKNPLSIRDLNFYKNTQDSTDLFEPWWSINEGAPTNQTDKLQWINGNMWAGTPAGLVMFEEDSPRIKHLISSNNGLPADNATSFSFSPTTNTIWAGTNQGLAEVDPQTASVLQTITRLEGLVDNEVWFYGSVYINSDGTVYYGTAKGISVYNPSKDRKNEQPPEVKLSNFISEQIQGKRNQFTFEYAALSFGNERQIQYQTRLLGFNNEWSQKKSETTINYTNLPAFFFPKNYTFEVIAINESEVASLEPLSYEFVVAPPALLQWWAFLGYLFILSIGVFGVDRFQRARLIKKEREAAHLRETELKAETAIARSNTAEAQAKALQAENDLKAAELEKARELEEAYHELKSTQNRLIQAEKMASLGRLSTGIAHEIKNPLNFINNFAEVSRELVGELKEAIRVNDLEEVEFILNSLGFNTEKIDEHGKRADAIVRSMMQHSRGTIGELEPVQINDLISKYTELAYHGRKVQIGDLDVSIHSDLDLSISEVSVMPQKMGQVLQNIIENAIDSVWEFAKTKTGKYKPVIKIKTVQFDSRVEIHISDNGPGIPEHIREKIFEPFFTTKPSGEGTGLGLSLSYDIVTQMHNGKLEIGTSELGGASFVISLPVNNPAKNKT